MDNNQLSSILAILIPNVVKEIIENENMTENEAINSFYESSLYSTLEEEDTKLWHLSPKALYELYKQERIKGIIEYPREQ